MIRRAHADGIRPIIVDIETNALLDLNKALLLASSHSGGAEDLVHLFEGESLGLRYEEPYEQSTGKGKCL